MPGRYTAAAARHSLGTDEVAMHFQVCRALQARLAVEVRLLGLAELWCESAGCSVARRFNSE